MDASEIRKSSIKVKSGEHSIFPIADSTEKLLVRPGSAGIVARFVCCVVDRWGWRTDVVSLDSGGLLSLRAVKCRRSSW